MKVSIKYLRWVFVFLYVGIILTFTLMGLLSGESDKQLWTAIGLGLFVVSQLVFVLGSGKIELCRPIRRRRLFLPVIAAGAMMAILAGALSLSLIELWEIDLQDNGENFIFWGIIIFSWIIWGILFYIHSHTLERFRAIKRLTTIVLGGSLIELLVAVPSHLVVSRRPGCLVGIYTMVGIVGGIYVMLWAFGPGIILLFLRDAYQKEKRA